jgi:hypothetical protein
MNKLDDYIQQEIAQFAGKLSLAVRRSIVEELRGMLSFEDGSRAPRRTASAPSEEAIIAFLQSRPDGVAASEIGAALGATPDILRPTLNRLRSDKKIRRTGERRGTRYSLKV